MPRWFQILSGSFLSLGHWRVTSRSPGNRSRDFCRGDRDANVWQWVSACQPQRLGGYLVPSYRVSASRFWCAPIRCRVHPLLAALAMSSKYLLRAGPATRRSHILNPANFAAFAAWAWIPGAWLSPGQWGSESLAAPVVHRARGLVTQRIQRWDVSVAFLGTWAALLVITARSGFDYSAGVGSAIMVAADQQWRHPAVRPSS